MSNEDRWVQRLANLNKAFGRLDSPPLNARCVARLNQRAATA